VIDSEIYLSKEQLSRMEQLVIHTEKKKNELRAKYNALSENAGKEIETEFLQNSMAHSQANKKIKILEKQLETYQQKQNQIQQEMKNLQDLVDFYKEKEKELDTRLKESIPKTLHLKTIQNLEETHSQQIKSIEEAKSREIEQVFFISFQPDIEAHHQI
jgi:uncharacterized protein YlxW (UPF0749 family)